MERRLELHNKFIDILGTKDEPISRVYFQPPASPNPNMKYPAIKYSLSGMDQKHANNGHYSLTDQYEVTSIGEDPDSDIPGKILNSGLMVKFDRRYVADGLYHDVFTIFH